MIAIHNEHLTATIKPFGAELCSLKNRGGEEFIWQAGSAWAKHSPVLFPIVGQLNNNTYRVGGQEYHLPRHGFAREREFSLIETADHHAHFLLQADRTTRLIYPFDFRLMLDYRLTGKTLRLTYIVENNGGVPLPFSLGAHPAFNWRRTRDMSLIFACVEPAPIRRLNDGLLSDRLFPTPVIGNLLPLSDALFLDDAIIFDHIQSRGVQFGKLHVAWCDAMPYLGLWTKPGADFLCIEPWAGYSDPAGFSGEFKDKPGVATLAAGTSAEFWWDVTMG
jgi:galactose mutarotase-like enzyme